MVILYILLGIILLFIIVLSIRVKIHFEYDETISCYAKWLFFKIPLYPSEDKTKKSIAEISEENTNTTENQQTTVTATEEIKPLNEDTEESAEYDFDIKPLNQNQNEATAQPQITENNDSAALTQEDSADDSINNETESVQQDVQVINNESNQPIAENQTETEHEPIIEERVIKIDNSKQSNKSKSKNNTQNNKEVKPNSITDFKALFTTYYDNTGIDGVIELAGKLLTALGHFSRRTVHWFVMDELYVTAVITSGDAASTAEKYGKYCSIIFPLFGNLIARFNVKKYDIDISPDYLANKGNATLVFTLSVIPRKMINTVFVLIFDIIVKFFLKLLKHGRLPENTENNSTENK